MATPRKPVTPWNAVATAWKHRDDTMEAMTTPWKHRDDTIEA